MKTLTKQIVQIKDTKILACRGTRFIVENEDFLSEYSGEEMIEVFGLTYAMLTKIRNILTS